ncbi:MAG TPA: hypothetical protein VEI82_03010 [Myxococcota bacterium]|nr:hypothetical protein [Myxococcota bacterium]
MAKAKGAILVGPVKLLRKRRADALTQLPPVFHRYLEDEIRLSGWYPEADFVELIRAAARLMPGTLEEAIEQIGALGAQVHANVYGDLIRTLTSSTVFALWSSQHDSGELRILSESPTSARAELSGFDSSSDVHCLLVRGYIRGGLLANELEDVHVEKLRCVLHGASTCSWRATWKNPETTPVTPGRRRRRSASRP